MRPLADALGKSGTDVQVIAGYDRDSARDQPTWGKTEVKLCRVVGPAALGLQPKLLTTIQHEAPDVVHLHGLWMYPSLATSRWSERAARPRVVSPHGMLDHWALSQSAWKKRLVASLYERRNLQGAACLHALNAAEYQAIRAFGLTAPVAIIPNGVDTDEAGRDYSPPPWVGGLPLGARVLLFLGRLHPKKGLPDLIISMAKIGEARLNSWYLVIAGWDQGGHEKELRRLAAAHGLSNRVRFVGPQFGEDKSATLAHVDAFVLPSRSEGLPMAVLEAWSFRLPVLMSDACNLPDGYANGAASRLSLDPSTMAADIERFLEMGSAQLNAMGNAGRALVEKRFTWPSAATKINDVYAWCCGRGPKPHFIHDK